MNTINWQSVKFRASSWGNLLAEPVSKADKEAGKLGVTCQKELIKIYNQVVYGRKEDIVTAMMDKGKQVEDESIALFSKVEGQMFFKNEDQLENDWFTGHPDIFSGDNIQNATEVHDIKSSWTIHTFMPKLIEEPDKSYTAQLNCYFSLTGSKSGSIVYCLTSAPPNIIEAEKRKLLYSMNVISELSPEYLRAVENLEKEMIFEDIDYRERVIKKEIVRDDELIEKMKSKVPVFRQWLQDFHEKHLALYPK